MEREIRFRGKNIKTEEWVYGFLYIQPPPRQVIKRESNEKESYHILHPGFSDWGMPIPVDTTEVDSKTIGQFTGLKDCKGRNIYEGDIYFEEVEEETGDRRMYYVCKWIQKWARFAWLSYGETLQKEETLEDDGTFGMEINDHFHFAGTIYENPDLLRIGDEIIN
jgi:uncharacterized phage protein (TIGR01671 family)